MIEILPLHDKKTLASINKEQGADSILAYCLYINGNIEGYILYGIIDKKTASLDAVKATDDAVTDGLVRAALSSLYDFGINRAVLSEKIDVSVFERLNLLKSGEHEIASIDDVLFNCKNCGEENK